MNLTREKTRPLLALGPGVLPDVRFAPKVVACTPLTVGTKNKAVTPAPAGPTGVRTLHCLQMSNALHVPFDTATARTAEGTRSPAYPRLVIATTIQHRAWRSSMVRSSMLGYRRSSELSCGRHRPVVGGQSGDASSFGQLPSRKRPIWTLLAILMAASLT